MMKLVRHTAPLLLLLGITVGAPFATLAAESVDFLVVVHEDNPIDSVTRQRLSKIFLKLKTQAWDGGSAVLPVDQSMSSPVRAAFSEAVHGKPVVAIRNYWQRQIFSGRTSPPPVVDSDQEVLEHVGSDAGAVGYVSVEARLPDGVKILGVEDLPGYGEKPQ